MTTVLLLTIFLIICISYGTIRTIGSKHDHIYNAKAGGTDETTDDQNMVSVLEGQPKVVRLPNGYYANTRDFHRLVVNGRCMEPVNVNDKEEWLAEKFNSKKSMTPQIKEGDVILIHLNDPDAHKNYYKIRRVKTIDNDKNIVDTYWYDNDGNKVASSKPHRKDLIMGVLRYKIS